MTAVGPATGDLAQRWRAQRPPVAGIHLDSAACSRQGFAALDAAANHARHEAEAGGYPAAEAAAPVLGAGRAAVAALTGFAADELLFTTGSGNALEILLADWCGPRTLACLPGEYGPNLAAFARHRFAVTALPVDPAGRLDPGALPAFFGAGPPAVVHLTLLGSHRGIVQPAAALTEICRGLGVPVFVDAAQGFAHVDCTDLGADALYGSSRKWTAGPRGVGVLATRPGLLTEQTRERVADAECNVAAQVGFSVALGAHLQTGPASVRSRLAEVGAATRAALAGVAGWQPVEPEDEPSAITTLVPPPGVDPVRVRARLIAEHHILTTAAGVARAPREMTCPVLRVSPHADVTAAELESLAAALPALS